MLIEDGYNEERERLDADVLPRIRRKETSSKVRLEEAAVLYVHC